MGTSVYDESALKAFNGDSKYGLSLRLHLLFVCCRVLTLSSGAGIVCRSVGGACINNFTFFCCDNDW